jgi:hypothetical protein
MAAFVQTNELQIKRITVKTTVPNNDVARLMYYLNCVCTAIDCKDDENIQRFISYQNWPRLSNDERKVLVDLCYTISPGVLNNKVFFQDDVLCVNFSNEFYEISKVRNQLLAVESIIIAGRTRQVNKIMVYKQEWMQHYYIGPMQRLTARPNNRTSSTVTHTRYNNTVNPITYTQPSVVYTQPSVVYTQPAVVKSRCSNKHKYICYGICCFIFFVLPIIIGIIIGIVNSKK